MFERFAEKWSLENVEFFTESLCGHLYKAQSDGNSVILKIYKDYGRLEESRGAELLKLWPSNIAVRVIQNDEDAVLLEYLSGKTLRSLVENGQDEEATQTIAKLVKDLHSIPLPKNAPDLPNLNEWFEALFRAAENKDHAYKKELNKAKAVALDLLAENVKPKMLHGDIHHENVIFSENGTPKLIDPKGIIGDPVYDIANTMRNPDIKNLVTKIRIESQIEIFHDILGYDKQRILHFGFVHAWLSLCWSWMDGDRDLENSIREAEILDDMVK